MASVINRPNGKKWVQFKGVTGRRHTVCLGKCDRRAAERFRNRIEDLISCHALGSTPDRETSHWLASLPVDTRNRLASLGLAEGPPQLTLSELIGQFFLSENFSKSNRCNIEQAAGSLQRFFGASRPVREITPEHATPYRQWLASSGGIANAGLAPATASRQYRRSRQLLQYAVRIGLITTNPFPGCGAADEVNREKDFFVSVEIIQSIMPYIRSSEFKAIIALARFGGLRCPSEILPMRWSNFNHTEKTILVTSTKTAHTGHGHRIIPLFPEIGTIINRLREEADPKQPLLFPKHQVTGIALSNELGRACRSAGIPLWPRPWQNMRATRETELLESFPLQVVSSWLGHSPKVALTHYAQTTKEHVARAVKMGKSVLEFFG